jgi:hypothetical protein
MQANDSQAGNQVKIWELKHSYDIPVAAVPLKPFEVCHCLLNPSLASKGPGGVARTPGPKFDRTCGIRLAHIHQSERVILAQVVLDVQPSSQIYCARRKNTAQEHAETTVGWRISIFNTEDEAHQQQQECRQQVGLLVLLLLLLPCHAT